MATVDTTLTKAVVTVTAKGAGTSFGEPNPYPNGLGYVSKKHTKATVTAVASDYVSTLPVIADVAVVATSTIVTSLLLVDTSADIGVSAYATAYVPYTQLPQIWFARPQTLIFDIPDDLGSQPTGAVRDMLEAGGSVYQSWKLGNQMIHYGNNSVMATKYFINDRNEPSISKKTIYSVGLLGYGTMCVDNPNEPASHYFIDKRGQLVIFRQDGVKAKDYSNQLSVLSASAILLYDVRYDCVRIADGTHGFTYSVKDDALGWGPPTITGCGMWNGTFYVTSPSGSITTPPLSCTTDILDMDTRDEKTIHELDFAVDETQDLYAAIDYRWNKAQSFYTTPWVKVDPHGRAFILCAGVEFRIKWKTLTYTNMRLDRVSVKVKYDNRKVPQA